MFLCKWFSSFSISKRLSSWLFHGHHKIGFNRIKIWFYSVVKDIFALDIFLIFPQLFSCIHTGAFFTKRRMFSNKVYNSPQIRHMGNPLIFAVNKNISIHSFLNSVFFLEFRCFWIRISPFCNLRFAFLSDCKLKRGSFISQCHSWEIQ